MSDPHIHINGEPQTVTAGTTLAELVAQRGLTPEGVAVEVNREVVPRSEYGSYVLQDGDRLEVVRAIGGG